MTSRKDIQPDRLLDGLKTLVLRGPVHHFQIVGSTNDVAKELGAGGAPEGTVIVAEGQTGGRGRLGRQWQSPPGQGLYVSLLLRPRLAPMELPKLTLTGAVAAVHALRRCTGLTPGIKWPNDLYLDGKKVGGILTEMETAEQGIRYLVLGLGLNINNQTFPPDLAAIATSLALSAGRPFSRMAVLKAWLEEFDGIYQRFLDRQFPGILAEWRRYAITLGRRVNVRQGLEVISGKALAVDEDGALLVETDSGEVARVTSGEIAGP